MAAPGMGQPTAEQKPKFKILEIPVTADGTTTIRRLVPATTAEDDIPVNATLLDERESDGILARSAKPVVLKVGLPVGYVSAEYGDLARIGHVDALLRSGKVRVVWDDTGMKETLEAKVLLVRY